MDNVVHMTLVVDMVYFLASHDEISSMNMQTQTTNDTSRSNEDRLEAIVLKTKRAFNRMSWLTPAVSMKSMAGAVFGRKIEASIRSLDETSGIMKINVHKREAAVVMTMSRYQELMDMMESCEQLLDAEASQKISDAADNFDSLYQRITSQKSAAAADSLFGASDADLRASFRPGRTEAE